MGLKGNGCRVQGFGALDCKASYEAPAGGFQVLAGFVRSGSAPNWVVVKEFNLNYDDRDL